MRYLVVVVALLWANQGAAEGVYVDVGECPGEGCKYDEQWVAKQPVTVLAEPRANATTLFTIPQGESVRTITGEVHTVPGRFVVHRDEDEFAVGDTVLVYTYLGEGYFRVLHNSLLKDANLHFSPWGGGSGTRCDNPQFCFGTLQKDLEFEWWVNVRTQNHMEGWILFATDSFKIPDTY